MVKIEEADDEDPVPVQPRHQQPQASAARHSPTGFSSLSPRHRHHGRSPPPSSSPAEPSLPPPHSPNSVSSISSDHTLHDCSPLDETPPSLSPSPPPSITPPPPDQPPLPALVPVLANRLIRDQPEVITKSEPDAETGTAGHGGGDGDAGVGVRRQRAVLRRAKGDKIVKQIALGLRICEFVVCLVSFSVMAADKHRGWAMDSFDRYVEFRYSMSVNVIGFAYSALQGLDLIYPLTASRSQLRYYFDFAMDQILAYLLLSSSSSAFTRVDDWISNWGQDKFPAMASASVGVSFFAFITFALSSLISGYVLCTHGFT